MQDTLFPEYHEADTVLGVAREQHSTGEPPTKLTLKEFIRKPVTLLIIGATLIGVAIALVFTVGRPGAPTPDSILKADGYSTTVTFNHDQLVQAMGGPGQDGVNPGDYFTTAAGGVNGNQEEVVLGVTDQGKGLEGLLVGTLTTDGVHAKTVDDGKFIVVSGSQSALGGLANLGTTTA